MNRRRSIVTGLAGLAGLSAVGNAAADNDKANDNGNGNDSQQLFFSYRNLVINFNIQTGAGTDIGTVDGIIAGTILQNFVFTFTSPTTVTTTSDRGLFTDLDGDQILFKYAGNGNFIAPLTDASSPLGNLMSVGGPFTITYTALSATGKYKFLIGKQFPGKIIATNAVNSSPGVLGSVYAEIYASGSDAREIKKALGQ